MNYSYYVWMTIFAIITYVIIVDPNGLRLIDLITKLIKINLERTYWIVRFHPKNPITNFLQRRKYAKIAEELKREFDQGLDKEI